MKTQAQRLPVDVKLTESGKTQRHARPEARRLGNSDISDLRGHRHALSIEARSKFKRLLDDIKQHIKTAEHKVAIK